MKRFLAVLAIFAVTSAIAMSIGKLNSASKEELMQIKGIGEHKAAMIIKERRKGKFKSFDDLAERVPGVGAQTAANIKSGVKNGEASAKATKAKKKAKKSKVKIDTSKKKANKKETSKKSKKLKEKTKKAEKELKKKKKANAKKSKKTKSKKKSSKQAA